MESDLSKERPNDARPRVLVVDDEANIRRAISLMLGVEFDVTAVESGDRAFEMIYMGEVFDVVSLDLDMPGMSGIETLKALKKKTPNTEVLILTAHSDLKSAKEALRLGAYEYIDKPFEKELLREAIRKGVERRKEAREFQDAQKKLEFVKAQLKQSEKFSAIGQLVAGVAHELNNPLAAIMGYSELLLMPGQPADTTRNYLENIRRSVMLCNSIIQNLLSFSRKKERKREYIQINPVIESTLELKKHDFKVDRILVFKDLAQDIPHTMADVHELQQVFLNIINNAHQAMKEENGEKRILTIRSEFDQDVIRIRFQDSGPGIPRENLQKIFEPLFTTKEEGKGTGLGLSICYEIIREHRGNIYVASELEKGATFVIELPITSQQAGHRETSDRGSEQP